jgi:tetratricopeptide (TPR) repeat protein
MTESPEAQRLVALGNELSEAGRKQDAEGAYRAATQADPDWSVAWYNLGLLCKYQSRWSESLAFNQRAALLDPEDEASWWNLGIAATALGDWSEARRAWKACGIELTGADGPPHGDFGLTPIRLDPEGSGEVVWARRFDPARARLASVPLPNSSFHYGDIVLHDGAAEGYRMVNDRQRPVFNVLALLERSEFHTFTVQLATTNPEVINQLENIAAELGGAAENWGTSTFNICRECSLGLPHAHDNEANVPAHPHCGVAARDAAHLKQILDRWLDTTAGADLVRWPDAPGNIA